MDKHGILGPSKGRLDQLEQITTSPNFIFGQLCM